MVQEDKMQVYQDIMEDIVNRTGGEYEKMSYTDKLMTISIMREIKENMDRYMKDQYPAVKAWASLDIRDIQLNEVEPDYFKLRKMVGVRV